MEIVPSGDGAGEPPPAGGGGQMSYSEWSERRAAVELTSAEVEAAVERAAAGVAADLSAQLEATEHRLIQVSPAAIVFAASFLSHLYLASPLSSLPLLHLFLQSFGGGLRMDRTNRPCVLQELSAAKVGLAKVEAAATAAAAAAAGETSYVMPRSATPPPQRFVSKVARGSPAGRHRPSKNVTTALATASRHGAPASSTSGATAWSRTGSGISTATAGTSPEAVPWTDVSASPADSSDSAWTTASEDEDDAAGQGLPNTPAAAGISRAARAAQEHEQDDEEHEQEDEDIVVETGPLRVLDGDRRTALAQVRALPRLLGQPTRSRPNSCRHAGHRSRRCGG